MSFAEKICNFFQDHAQNKAKKCLKALKIQAGGGGFCVFVKFFGALFGFGKFFGLLNFWALFGMC